jgi:hypothetical protein
MIRGHGLKWMRSCAFGCKTEFGLTLLDACICFTWRCTTAGGRHRECGHLAWSHFSNLRQGRLGAHFLPALRAPLLEAVQGAARIPTFSESSELLYQKSGNTRSMTRPSQLEPALGSLKHLPPLVVLVAQGLI